MSGVWEDIGFVISSKYRVDVLRRLAEGPATPSQLANDTDLSISHVSRTLNQLRDRGLVELLVPEDRRKGRIYGITENGAEVWERIDSENIVE